MATGNTLLYEFSLDESSQSIVKRCQNDLIDILQRKFGCEAQICDVDLGAYAVTYQAGPDVPKKPMFSAVLPSQVKVSVWKSDLTCFPADAVVNAANTKLDHAGGLALALSKAGGPEIQKESNDYVRKNGHLQTGEAVLTGAGKLRNCKNIIHAVGPQLFYFSSPSEINAAEALLNRAIISILNCVKNQHFRSVAIPAISSGIYNFPLQRCADTIVKSVKKYYESSDATQYRPAEVFLVNHDERSAKEMERACRQQLSSVVPPSYSQVTAGKRGGASPEGAPNTVNIGKVQLMLRRGNIENQMTDVIVNTAAQDRDLSAGLISGAISKRAGKEMQSEIRRAKSDGLVMRTKGYKLQCKEVYHTFCVRGQVEQTLHAAVQECLKMAVKSEHRSIAFPAIGTGNLQLPPEKAAQIMTAAVSNFAKTSKGPLDVHFVIFPSDAKTFTAFEREIQSLQEGRTTTSRTTDANNGGKQSVFSSSGKIPRVSLIAPSDEARREVDRWLRELFDYRSNITIQNNFILHLGERELRQLSGGSASVEERFESGRASIAVQGRCIEAATACVKVEAILCNVMTNFISEEEHDLRQRTNKTVSYKKQTSDFHRMDISCFFKQSSLLMLKVEELENGALKELFDLKKKQLKCSSHRTMFQRVPRQFIELICRIGFHAECAPPQDPAYGEGIYFAGTVQAAMKLWGEPMEEYLYFVEAAVLTGNSTSGSRGLILPPPVGKDSSVLHDSVSGGPDISVIFSGCQALPKCIITCKTIN